ncbi:MAG: ribonuclease Z, partial [Spirochaetales bacterium]|nr:ribonuclease Z [Spirochaetales bacterium]MCF7938207.1 ribonuclease Z [Spirochaetales bacterium]
TPRTVYQDEGFTIKSIPLQHSKPCVGYTLEEDPRSGVFYPERAKEAGVPMGPLWARLQRGEAVVLESGEEIRPGQVLGPARKGRKVSFVTDTAYRKDIAARVHGSDLLICEGMFAEDLAESAAEKKHLTSRQAARIADDAGAIKKMGLIHYSPRYTERELKHLVREAQEIFPDTFLTRDRQIIPIPHEEEVDKQGGAA